MPDFTRLGQVKRAQRPISHLRCHPSLSILSATNPVRGVSVSKTSQTIREKLHVLADNLPADASWDDVIEEARFRKAVEQGIAAADRGAFATDAEVNEAFSKWGVKS